MMWAIVFFGVFAQSRAGTTVRLCADIGFPSGPEMLGFELRHKVRSKFNYIGVASYLRVTLLGFTQVSPGVFTFECASGFGAGSQLITAPYRFVDDLLFAYSQTKLTQRQH